MKNQYLLIDKDTQESQIYDNKTELTAVLRTSGMEAGALLDAFMVFEIDLNVGPLRREIDIPGPVGKVSRLTII